MSLLNLEHIGIEFGGRWLLSNTSYQFNSSERIGLIGRNGAGKSTLLKIIAGDLSPTQGFIHKSNSLHIAYFNQDLLSYQSDNPIQEIVRQAYGELLQMESHIESLQQQLEAGSTDPALWNELVKLQQLFETKGGHMIDANVHSVLSGLGFSDQEHSQPFSTFSGGWRMRVMLAKMLLMQPDLLLLDEPTNHLDLPSIQWLENYLKTFSGTCLIVSHDRFFLDRMAEKILEISHQKLNFYGGNYTYYLKEKQLREEQQRSTYENQQKYIAQQEQFINRFRAKATKARQVQSKIKQLEKIDRVEAPETESIDLNIQFEMKYPSGKEVLNLENISKSYDSKRILQHTSATVLRGDKIALIGANGTGKSTLLRILADREPYEGTRREGHNVVTSFFAQHQLEALDLKKSILEEISYHAADRTETYHRNILGCFMFSGDEVEKKIQILSGGEKSRVALAKILLSEANFLLLDEPTNHLDIQSIQILVEALNNYPGTYIVVSHDRFFLQKIANKIWYLEDHQIKEYPGTYEEYERWRRQQLEEQTLSSSHQPSANNIPQGGRNDHESESQPDFQEQKKIKNRIKKLKKEISEAEKQISTLESDLQNLEWEMAKPEVAADFDQLHKLQQTYQSLQQKLEESTLIWEEHMIELEELEQSTMNS